MEIENGIEGVKETGEKLSQVTCRKCGFGPYTPSPGFDFYRDSDDSDTGLCETCIIQEAMAESSKEPVEVSEQRRKVLCMGDGKEGVCRFLVFGGKFECAKGSKLESSILAKKDIMNAQGDNCSGPPCFLRGC